VSKDLFISHRFTRRHLPFLLDFNWGGGTRYHHDILHHVQHCHVFEMTSWVNMMHGYHTCYLFLLSFTLKDIWAFGLHPFEHFQGLCSPILSYWKWRLL